MFELSGLNYEEVLEQRDSILVRVIASSSYRGVRVIGIILYLQSFIFDYIRLNLIAILQIIFFIVYR